MFSKLVRYIFVLVLVAAMLPAYAQRWSYIYIQGDKQLPFYVKLEGEMLPRYGKNYCIIPQLEAGLVHLQVLFQQNQYPSQNYTIKVPQEGSRGFLLTRKDNVYALFDIAQQFYLLPGEEDHLPVTGAESAPEGPLVQAADPVPEKEVPRERTHKPRNLPKGKVKTKNPSGSTEPQFIDNLVLRNEHTSSPAEDPVPKPVNSTQAPGFENGVEDAAPGFESGKHAIRNSDCPKPMPDEDFNSLFGNDGLKENDKLLTYLYKKTMGNCFTTRQVYLMAKKLESESVRYSFLKKVYSRVTDQQNFYLLESYLFQTREWKDYFRLIQKP